MVRLACNPVGKGIQKIVDAQTNEDLERGTAASLPIFSDQRDEVVVKTGTWVTLRFRFRDFQSGACPPALTPELSSQLLDDAIEFVDNSGLTVSFDEQDLSIAPYFRTSGINYFYSPGTDQCVYDLPWRFYVNPKAKGSYDHSAAIGGNSFTRLVTWSPKAK
jgi:hypothetical protein